MAIQDFKIIKRDVFITFLNTKTKKQVFINQPSGFNNGIGKVYKLLYTLYRLCTVSL